MEACREFFEYLVAQGGPDPAEYDELNAHYRTLATWLRENRITYGQLDRIWSSLGEAFYSTKTMQGLVFVKPYGYAGDFEVIDRIYQGWICPEAHLAKWDRYFQDMQAAHAVRNRKDYFHALLAELAQGSTGEPLKVLNVGSGPARDVREALQHHGEKLTFECIDQDPHAIRYGQHLTEGFPERVQFQQKNALRLALAERYPLIWSAGLFDYLSDKAFCAVLKRLLTLTTSGGQIVIGNFSPENSSRDCMECGNWLLHHRTAAQLRELATRCGVSPERIFVGTEPEGVNLFLHIQS